jgi:hypothetical protein
MEIVFKNIIKYIIITFLALIIISYETKKPKHNNSAKINETISKNISDEEKTSTDKSLISLLKQSQIISHNYSDSKIKLLCNSILNDSSNFSAIQFPFDSTIQDLYESELLFNVMILHKKNEIRNYLVIDAMDEEDFNFITSSKDFIVYEFYSSPVGYTIYYILNSENQKLFKSEPIEEGYIIDTSKINFIKNTISATFSKKKSYILG